MEYIPHHYYLKTGHSCGAVYAAVMAEMWDGQSHEIYKALYWGEHYTRWKDAANDDPRQAAYEWRSFRAAVEKALDSVVTHALISQEQAVQARAAWLRENPGPAVIAPKPADAPPEQQELQRRYGRHYRPDGSHAVEPTVDRYGNGYAGYIHPRPPETGRDDDWPSADDVSRWLNG